MYDYMDVSRAGLTFDPTVTREQEYRILQNLHVCHPTPRKYYLDRQVHVIVVYFLKMWFSCMLPRVVCFLTLLSYPVVVLVPFYVLLSCAIAIYLVPSTVAI